MAGLWAALGPGQLGKPAQASPDGSAFFTVTPRVVGRDGKPVPAARLMTARPCLGGRLWVTRFHMEALRSGHRVEAIGEPRYWDALRPHADTIVIDTPAADRNDMAIILAPFVDMTVLVVAAESTAANEPLDLQGAVVPEAAGGLGRRWSRRQHVTDRLLQDDIDSGSDRFTRHTVIRAHARQSLVAVGPDDPAFGIGDGYPGGRQVEGLHRGIGRRHVGGRFAD